MQKEKFKKLIEIIFNQTFGILKDHNTDPDRNGHFSEFFASAYLGNDLKNISNRKSIRDPGIYVAAINKFFTGNNPECIEKTIVLIERLETEGYIIIPNDADILTKCDQNTLPFYHKIVLNIWNFYYSQYMPHSNKNMKIYILPQDDINNIIRKFTEFHLPVELNFYQQRIPDIMKLLRTNNPISLYKNLETEYIHFFKDVLEKKSFYTLSRKDRIVFFNTLYAFSDLLDQSHHEDSYKINLEILTFFNQIYNDNYMNISINDIRKIQGCIYAISIEDSTESIQGNMTFTSNKNLARLDIPDCKPITLQTKLDMCCQALKNLLSSKILRKLNEYFKEENYIPLYENRLQKNRDISTDKINELYVLSLVYSNIAACTLQYIKKKINMHFKYNEYIKICEIYHERSRYIRNLIIRITKKMYGETSSEYKESLYFLAAHYHSIATKYFYIEKYADSIAIRSVLYSFYTTMNLKEKAHAQLELAPINRYEQNGGNSHSYSQTTKSFFQKHKKDFSYLFTKEMMSYDDFRQLITEYQKYKDLF